jgi:AcrR family transcriptional regulator
VITPTGQPSRVSESPSTTFVITEEEVRRSGAQTLPEILRRVPGIDVRMLAGDDGQIGPRGFAYEYGSRLLLRNWTRMPVVQVRGEVPVEADHVYVIPPNATMVIANRVLKITRPEQSSSHLRRPVDAFFASLADDIHSAAIGVVLSGAASDGTLGLKAIKAEGGVTFAQDQSATFDGMPRSAIAAGFVDFVLPPKGIAHEITAIASHPLTAHGPEQMIENSPVLERIMTLVHARTGVDFRQYKPGTVLRRLARRMVLEKGYNKISIRDIAKECGIATGTFYNYFRSKQAIVSALLAEDWAMMERMIKAHTQMEAPPINQLETVFFELKYMMIQVHQLWAEGLPDDFGSETMNKMKMIKTQLHIDFARIVRDIIHGHTDPEREEFFPSSFPGFFSHMLTTKTRILPICVLY